MTINQVGWGLEMVVHRLILPLHAEGGQVEQAGLVLDKDEEQLARMFSWGFDTVLTNLKK